MKFLLVMEMGAGGKQYVELEGTDWRCALHEAEQHLHLEPERFFDASVGMDSFKAKAPRDQVVKAATVYELSNATVFGLAELRERAAREKRMQLWEDIEKEERETYARLSKKYGREDA